MANKEKTRRIKLKTKRMVLLQKITYEFNKKLERDFQRLIESFNHLKGGEQ